MRGPGAVAAAIHGACLRLGKPYGVEVLGDPYEAFAPGSVDHPLRVVFRYWFTRQLMRMCREACAVAYVTRSALQRRYPPRADAFVIDFSDVDLSPRAYVGQPRSAPCQEGRVRLVTVGSLAQLYKGTDVLLEAVARCVGSGRDIELAIVGDGRYRPQLAARAAALGLADRVVFRGRLPPGEAVRAELDRADLFVLPSRSEGLPKALLEAMARGLPCIASAVGGIPELLAKDDLVAPGDVEQLACKISSVLDEPGRMVAMSARNLRRASEYSADAQQRRRVAFLRAVRAATEAWEGGSGRDRSRAVRI
ncbi:MAG: glycosyltransferase [Anaerolineae bacterium]